MVVPVKQAQAFQTRLVQIIKDVCRQIGVQVRGGKVEFLRPGLRNLPQIGRLQTVIARLLKDRRQIQVGRFGRFIANCPEGEDEWLAGETEPIIVKYLNRLSDYLFILSRYTGHQMNIEEIPWKPRL